jgi:hypothetical protein
MPGCRLMTGAESSSQLSSSGLSADLRPDPRCSTRAASSAWQKSPLRSGDSPRRLPSTTSRSAWTGLRLLTATVFTQSHRHRSRVRSGESATTSCERSARRSATRLVADVRGRRESPRGPRDQARCIMHYGSAPENESDGSHTCRGRRVRVGAEGLESPTCWL